MEIYQNEGYDGGFSDLFLISYRKRETIDFTGYSVGIQTIGQEDKPYIFRHSFALAYIENGGDPFSLQRILGHSSQETTSKYVNMVRTNVKSQHSKYSPGERLG